MGSSSSPFASIKNSKRSNQTLRLIGLISIVTLIIGWFSISSLYNRENLSPLSIATQGKSVEGKFLPLGSHFTGDHHSTSINSTLGFEKMFVIGLPNRLDRRDQLAVFRQVSGIDWDYLDGVTPPDLVGKRLPWYTDERMEPGTLGCLRGHIEAWKKMVNENIETALIVEEDFDFVKDIRGALQKVKQPLANLFTTINKNGKKVIMSEEDPWSKDDWDMIQFGACTEKPFTSEFAMSWTEIYKNNDFYSNPPYYTYDDATIPDKEFLRAEVIRTFDGYKVPLARSGNEDINIQRKRIVQHSFEPWCTTAYALTRRGAARLLYAITLEHNNPVDVVISFSVLADLIRSYSIVPPLFGQFKTTKKDGPSDRENPSGVGHRLKEKIDPWDGLSENIGLGFRSLIPKIMLNRKTP